MSDKPNIVIFMTDQWRGDYIGAAGHRIVKTPNHDRIAEDGMVFTQCYTTHPICGPSRASFCTGWYPHTRGHRSQEYLIRHDEPHLFQYLKDEGYHIAWTGKNDMLTPELIETTADQRVGTPDGDGHLTGGNPYEKSDPRFYTFYHGEQIGDKEAHQDVRRVRWAQEFLRNPPKEPFCLLLTLGYPHPPYAAPEPYFSMYPPADMEPAIACDYGDKPAFMKALNRYSGLDRVDEEHVRKMRALYCGMITMMDDLLGDLMTTLTDTGLAESTALFVTSDHGNFTGDYGLAEKWHTAWQDAIFRVPLAVRLPGGGGRHGISGALTQHIDVFGTILDLVGIRPRWNHFAESLLPILHGETEDVRDAVFGDSGCVLPDEIPWSIARLKMDTMDEDNPYYSFYQTFRNQPHAASRSMCVRDRRWKFIWRQKDVHELYDLQADPDEVTNLLHNPSPDAEREASRLRERLLRWVAETGDVMPLAPAMADELTPANCRD